MVMLDEFIDNTVIITTKMSDVEGQIRWYMYDYECICTNLKLMIDEIELEIYWWVNEYTIVKTTIWDKFMVNIIIITIEVDELDS